jgi:alpha-glucosidase
MVRRRILSASGLLAISAVVGAAAPGAAEPPVGWVLDDGMIRCFKDAEAMQRSTPSFALSSVPGSRGPIPEDFPVKVRFSTTEDGKECVHIPIEPGTSLYGAGPVHGPLLRNGRTVVCWNTHAGGSGGVASAMSQSHPWILAVRTDGTAFGVLADTTWRCTIDLTDGIRFTADGPPFPVLVVNRESPEVVMRRFAICAGLMPMPPKWAVGFHQGGPYATESRVRGVAAGFRDRQIPCDAIWLDTDVMDDQRVFTIDPDRFPDPPKLIEDLLAQGLRTVWRVDPAVKALEGCLVYGSGTEGEHWVQTAGGETYRTDSGPGGRVFPDFTRPETQDWWAEFVQGFMSIGAGGMWCDMNEPAIPESPTGTMPEDNLHRGGRFFPKGLIEPGPHARYHNVYGSLMAGATRRGIRLADVDKRPFVATRAGFMGTFRSGATWTGDSAATWDDLAASVPMTVSLSLCAQPLSGALIGGTTGEADGTLYARWMGIGSLLPLARAHSGPGTMAREPWAFGPEVERTCRAALQRRYRLVPYLYTLIYRASKSGLPIARPAFFADPRDPALRGVDDCFLLGPDLLVVGAVTPDRSRVSAMPRGHWPSVSLVEGDTADPDLPALRLRPGGIVPVGPIMEYVDQRPLDPLTLMVCLDENGRAYGELYEDRGEGHDEHNGQFLFTCYEARTEDGAVVVRPTETHGLWQRPDRRLVVELHHPKHGLLTAEGKDGDAIRVALPGS